MESTTTTASKSFNPPDVKLHFLDYWRIIRIRKTVILAVFLLVAITTTLITFILPESFSSTVRLKVEKDTPDVNVWDASRPYWPQGHDPYWVQDQFETIQSKAILYPVITNLGLTRKWAEKHKVLSRELTITEAYGALKSDIEVRQYRNTSLIEIRAFSDNPREAASIANEIADVYRNYRTNLRLQMSTRGIKILEEELSKHEEKVRVMQAHVSKLKEDLRISDYEAQGVTYAMPSGTPEPEILRRLEGQRIEAEAEFRRFEALYSHLTNLTSLELKKAIATAYPDTLLTTLLDHQNQSEQKLAELIETFAPEHPEVKQVSRMLAQIKQQVDDRLEGILKGIAARVESEHAHVQALTDEAKKFKEFEIKTAIERRPYWDSKRELENLMLVRDRLNLRIIQEKVEAAIPQTSMVEILDSAEPNLRAVRPNKILNIGLGIILGLVVGVGLAFFIEYLDTSVKTIDDVERALQAPVLGVIPQNVGSLLEEGPDSPHAEAYRVLHTNILFSQKDPKLNTLTVVSAGAGEGKSTTVFNLATTFARGGQRVLIVDSDLRRPSLHKFLKVSNSIGLTNYLLRQNSLEDVIQTTGLPTLDFMPSGKLPSSSMGLLSSTQMKELIRDLKRRYEWVFFDSPPVMGVSDASILASEVDLVLQVIQYRRYPQPMTIRAKQMVEKVGGNHLGIVLNNISMSSDESYYYYSGYYYDYYSRQEEEPAQKAGGEPKKAAAAEDKVEIKPKY